MGSGQRFGSLFSESPERPIWDTVVARVGQFAVAPTKGSIIPNWLLLVPEKAELNFAKLQAVDHGPLHVMKAVADKLSVQSDTIIWFEHGACVPGTTVGCGVDHAHLHMLVAPSFAIDQFRTQTEMSSQTVWSRESAATVYSRLDGNQSYYVFGSGSDAWYLRDVNLGSQFFRRVVAILAGTPEEWDYRLYDGKANVERTLRHLVEEAA